MYEITAIPKEKVDEYWDDLKPFFEAANASYPFSLNKYSIEAIYDDAIFGEILLIKIGDVAAAALEIAGESLHGVSLAGEDMDEWLGDLDVYLKAMAKELGLKEITLLGRKGWSKVLKKFNYEHGFTMYGVKL